jgi:DNA adenine methylase
MLSNDLLQPRGWRDGPAGAAPFLKWPGGKRWLAPWLADLVRDNLTGRYFEPFLGGGSLFFCLQPSCAMLSDVNGELIETYVAVRDSHREVLRLLRKMPVSDSDYYLIRGTWPASGARRAARFLYLNRTGFGGMFRVNQFGKFNVPYGGGERTPECLYSGTLLQRAAALLARAELRHSDFEPILDMAQSGDVVYCDPTYTATHNNNGFVRYNERNFSWEDQRRLASAARRAQLRGAFLVVSSACHCALRRLYPWAEVYVVQRPSLVAPKTEFRRTVTEYVFVLDPDACGP